MTLRRYQAGLSLIETMIALLLGLLLVAAVGHVLFSTQMSYRSQQGFSSLQENSRFAFHFLNRFIRMAGYHTDPLLKEAGVFLGANAALSGTEGGGSNPDSITIRFQGDGVMENCLGAVVPANTLATVTFSVDATNHELNCSDGVNTAILVGGVENMQILYGVDVNGDGSANSYVAADSATMATVISVRIALLVNTGESQNLGQGLDTRSYDLLGTTYDPADDLLRRRVGHTVIQLRNRTS